VFRLSSIRAPVLPGARHRSPQPSRDFPQRRRPSYRECRRNCVGTNE
jgi:hypothetical protein